MRSKPGEAGSRQSAFGAMDKFFFAALLAALHGLGASAKEGPCSPAGT